jgi:hypothetical protein
LTLPSASSTPGGVAALCQGVNVAAIASATQAHCNGQFNAFFGVRPVKSLSLLSVVYRNNFSLVFCSKSMWAGSVCSCHAWNFAKSSLIFLRLVLR